MKNIFKIKLELIQLISAFISTLLIWSINETYHNDYRIMILSCALVGVCIVSIIAYKPIKEFRHEVLRRW